MSESSLCAVRATVLLYDDSSKRWVPAGSDATHVSRVQIYHNATTNTFRVVGRKLQADQQVVLNCPIVKGMKYNQATATFHQWRDPKQVWGLNFGNKEDAALFANSMTHALEVLSGSGSAGSANNGPSPQQLEEQKRLERQKQEQLEREQKRPDTPASSPAAPPAPPPPPPAPTPPAPPPPPCGGAVPPAPPPPPEGGSGKVGGQGGGSDLASALAGAKLRKTVKDEGAASAPAPKASSSSSSGGGGGGGLMGEMSAILARRKKAADKPVEKVKEPCDEECAPANAKSSGSGAEINEPKYKSASTPRPKTATQKDISCSTSAQSPGSRLKVVKKKSDGEEGDDDMERVKQEIIEEVKKELNKMKDEIIKALIEELQR
ncbi:vasodilator-stimulated phosphoprotein-like isoform X1 [Xiphophorus maculatus]|uniref:Vasodilator-stimulated phosphoprotein-like n=1 Tax=Xiphophorus maculatus TaxID=8083 RepID=M3ZHG5_XIPMA|nr:vasodilator-stimulated phosphoprotein-like isoform X1 [Xiphophorus maculatus]XP_027888309.1 vasodilator-stimulated phosphoprotein-like [Xiphophorus couchianus]XP_032431982.1 vasodilator-stimulated phosphoprotein-like [Xiphophorus hellerii]